MGGKACLERSFLFDLLIPEKPSSIFQGRLEWRLRARLGWPKLELVRMTKAWSAAWEPVDSEEASRARPHHRQHHFSSRPPATTQHLPPWPRAYGLSLSHHVAGSANVHPLAAEQHPRQAYILGGRSAGQDDYRYRPQEDQVNR